MHSTCYRVVCFTVLYKALASLQNNPNNDWHTRSQKASRKVKKARKIQRHRPLVISSSLQRGVFSHRHLHKEHCEQCTVLTLCTATITIYARSIFLSVYSTSTISRLLLLFSRKSVNIPMSDNLSRSRSSQPLCPVNHGRTFLLFMLFCVITLVCTSKQSRATELFMNYTT